MERPELSYRANLVLNRIVKLAESKGRMAVFDYVQEIQTKTYRPEAKELALKAGPFIRELLANCEKRRRNE